MDGSSQTLIIPDYKDRAYVNSILINQDARTMIDYETFDLRGLSTGSKLPDRSISKNENCKFEECITY